MTLIIEEIALIWLIASTLPWGSFLRFLISTFGFTGHVPVTG